MEKQDNNLIAFVALLRAGLWADVESTDLSNHGFADSVDWENVYQLAEEQSVIGVVLSGIEHSKEKPPQELLLQWIGEVQILEQRNKTMNEFVAAIVQKMRNVGIYTLLVKGQSVAQCYERPLWRACGDVDFFLSDSNYNSAKEFLEPLSSATEDELEAEKHIQFSIDNWIVELHGNLPSRLFSSIDRELEDIQYDIFYRGNVRSWLNGDTVVFLPSIDNDVLLIFTHILKHFFRGGIGLRQICDWCRFVYIHNKDLDKKLLEKRLDNMGIMTEWKVFASLAVYRLGMPQDTMPFYSAGKWWKKKSDKALEFILETGNFGQKRDYSYYEKYPYIVWKTISFWKHTKDGLKYFAIFPLDSLKVWGRMASEGILELFKKKKMN